MISYPDLSKLEYDITRLQSLHTPNLVISKYISYITTGDCESPYVPNLELALRGFDIVTRSNILIKLMSKRKLMSKLSTKGSECAEQLVTPEPNFELVHLRDVHKFDFLYSCLLPFSYISSDVLLDVCLDETFGPNCDVYKLLERVPYTKKWYGFIHDPVGYVKLFDNIEFVNSLRYCGGLLVFSQALKNQVETTLLQKQLVVKVFYLYYPVPEPPVKFDTTKFNAKPSIVNVGQTAIYSFYKTNPLLRLSSSTFDIWNRPRLVPLDKYLLNPTKSDVISLKLLDSLEAGVSNEWDLELHLDILKVLNSVNILICKESDPDYIPKYSELLSRSIVYSNVLNGSAIVQLNECIVRNTPIVINRHPAVVELLGVDYPLYFNDDKELVLSTNQIKKAHEYLVKLTKVKTKLHPATFICTLNNFIS